MTAAAGPAAAGGDERRRFVLELGRALHALGSPAYRVEDAMVACARALGLEGAFFATPTAIFAQLGPPGTAPFTTLQRVPPGEHDLGKLARLYAERDAVVGGRCSAADGLRRLDVVMQAPPAWPPLAEWPCWGLIAAAAAVFLGGGLAEVAVASGAGLVVGALAQLAARAPRFGRVFEPTAGAVAAFVAHGAAHAVALDPGVAVLASIIALLPGLVFTTALTELSMRHLAAGSARLLGALATMLTMAVGVGLGTRLGVLAFGVVATPVPEPLAAGWQLPAAAAAAVAFAVLLRASRAQLATVGVAVAVAYAGGTLGGLLFERELAAFVGAFGVACAANLYARWFRQPGAVVRTPGLLLLVPGSLGFRGLSTALQRDFTQGAQFGLQMLLVGGALVAGLLLASALLPPPLDVEST
ncbi:MAG: threonine/serine exporter family protein [Planctomycetota bacterium]